MRPIASLRVLLNISKPRQFEPWTIPSSRTTTVHEVLGAGPAPSGDLLPRFLGRSKNRVGAGGAETGGGVHNQKACSFRSTRGGKSTQIYLPMTSRPASPTGPSPGFCEQARPNLGLYSTTPLGSRNCPDMPRRRFDFLSTKQFDFGDFSTYSKTSPACCDANTHGSSVLTRKS